jgi:hypothetical protein
MSFAFPSYGFIMPGAVIDTALWEERKMKRIFFVTLGAAAALATLFAAAAEAQVPRTFVSGLGSDANACSRVAPCRTFAAALALTSAGGEIAVLDPAGYSAVTITQSVSIVNDGVGEAATPGITINAGASDVINLRGLTMNGAQSGAPADGIAFVNGGTLDVQNCVIRGFSGTGITFYPGTAAKLNISDTLLSNNNAGVVLSPIGTTIASFVRVQATGNYYGLVVNGANGVIASAADSIASGNTFGFLVQAGTFTIVNGKAIGNSLYGVSSNGSNAAMYVANSTITGNQYGYASFSGGIIYTFGNNFITDQGVGTLTPVSQQ